MVRDSAAAVQQELLACYALIERLGRGVVYYGSARLKAASPHWDRARQLGADVARQLGATTWSGGGPGMMEAATLGVIPSSTCAVPYKAVSAVSVRRCLSCGTLNVAAFTAADTNRSNLTLITRVPACESGHVKEPTHSMAWQSKNTAGYIEALR